MSFNAQSTNLGGVTSSITNQVDDISANLKGTFHKSKKEQEENSEVDSADELSNNGTLPGSPDAKGTELNKEKRKKKAQGGG